MVCVVLLDISNPRSYTALGWKFMVCVVLLLDISNPRSHAALGWKFMVCVVLLDISNPRSYTALAGSLWFVWCCCWIFLILDPILH